MLNKKLTRFATLTGAFALVLCSFQASPEDIDIFSVDESSSVDKPNVLIVVDNSANWNQNAQAWPNNLKQGQSEMRAIKKALASIPDGAVNLGLMMFSTKGDSNTNKSGYVHYHIRPMNAANKAAFGAKLDEVAADLGPFQKDQNNAFGHLMWDVYNYLGGLPATNGGVATNPSHADTAGYATNYSRFRSPLTSANTCTRTILIFVGNNSSSGLGKDDTPTSASIDALKNLGGSTIEIPFAEYTVESTPETLELGYSRCFLTAAACTTAVNTAECIAQGFNSCSCDAADAQVCPSNKYTVKGIKPGAPETISDTTVPAAGDPPITAYTNEAILECKTDGQTPAYPCPQPSTVTEQNTPQPGQTRRTTTSWANCKYVATTACATPGGGVSTTKFNREPRGDRTVRTVVTASTTQTETVGMTSACFTSTTSCSGIGFTACADGTYSSCFCATPSDSTGCAASGTSRFQMLGHFNSTVATETGTYGSPPGGVWIGDEWTRFLQEVGVPLPDTSPPVYSPVTTYTLDVFNAKQDATYSAMMFNMARVTGGKYYQTKNEDQIQRALEDILTEVQAVNSAFSSASLPVNATNRAQNENQVFIGLFRPDKGKKPRWFGNLKRFQLVSSAGLIQLGDEDGDPAINNLTGFIGDCANSYWTTNSGNYWERVVTDNPPAIGLCTTSGTSPHSDLPDGPFVEKGAVAEVLRKGNSPTATPDTDGNYLVNRNLLTRVGADLVPFTAASTGLDAVTANFSIGQDVFDDDLDCKGDPAPARCLTEPRSTIHGDVIHSRPLPINYGSPTGVVVFYGANDGTFRAVSANTGRELWSFIAPEHLGKLNRLTSNAPNIRYFADDTGLAKDYFFDGATGVFQSQDNSKIWIYPTMRRGGRRVYGLDVTNPTTPDLLWTVGCDSSSCPADFSAMGQSWALPNVALIKGYCGATACPDDKLESRKPVIVLGGGYDPCEDANTWEPACSSATGRGVYVIDAETGKLVRYFDFAALGVDARSVAADVALIDVDGDSMVDYGYAVDTGGNAYRFDFVAGKVAIANPNLWPHSRVAFTNKAGRKFLFPPALVQVTSTKIYLAVGSGDREHPLMSQYPFDERDGDNPDTEIDDAYDLVPGNDDTNDPGVVNRFYVFKDNLEDVSAATELNLDLPCPAPPAAPTAGCLRDYSAGTSCGADPVLPADVESGWFMELGANGKGEQVVTSAVVAGGFVFFSTNRPTPNSTTACTTSLGEARGYFMNLLNASGAIGVTGACDGERSSVFVGGGLPPSPVLATVPIDGELRTVVIGAVQKTGEPSSPIEAQRVRPPIASDRKPIYWYKSTGDK